MQNAAAKPTPWTLILENKSRAQQPSNVATFTEWTYLNCFCVRWNQGCNNSFFYESLRALNFPLLNLLNLRHWESPRHQHQLMYFRQTKHKVKPLPLLSRDSDRLPPAANGVNSPAADGERCRRRGTHKPMRAPDANVVGLVGTEEEEEQLLAMSLIMFFTVYRSWLSYFCSFTDIIVMPVIKHRFKITLF